MSRTVVFAAAVTFVILFSGIQAQVNVKVSFTRVFYLEKNYVSQDDDDKVGCFVEGECLDSLLLTEISAETPEDCLVLCQVRICSCFQAYFVHILLEIVQSQGYVFAGDNDACQYFTHFADSEVLK